MSDVAQHLESLRQRIAGCNEADTASYFLQHLAIIQTGDTFHLDFYGDCFEDGYPMLLETLARPDIAPHIRSLMLRGPDEGANGTHHWDIEPLLETDAIFSQLETFSIQLNQPADHNRSIVAADYDEGGVLARLLAKSPALANLTVPSAPNSEFFDVGDRPLRFLSVDAGYDTQDFISHLAKSSCFRDLSCLEWGEYHETYLEDFADHCTPRECYHELWTSRAFSSIKSFVWRNPVCTDEEIRTLKKLTPDLQLLVVRYSGEYL